MNTSVVSYPERGPYGDNKYRGNCSGYLIKDLLEHYKPKSVLDPMEGSGTTRDVCKELNIEYQGEDLHKGQNALFFNPETQIERFEFIFFHPPYWDIIQYSEHALDLSVTQKYSKYVLQLRTVFNNLIQRIQNKGHIAILIGDIRKQGRYYHPIGDIWSLLEGRSKGVDALIIKIQHNVDSNDTLYSNSNIIRIMHEYCVVLRM